MGVINKIMLFLWWWCNSLVCPILPCCIMKLIISGHVLCEPSTKDNWSDFQESPTFIERATQVVWWISGLHCQVSTCASWYWCHWLWFTDDFPISCYSNVMQSIYSELETELYYENLGFHWLEQKIVVDEYYHYNLLWKTWSDLRLSWRAPWLNILCMEYHMRYMHCMCHSAAVVTNSLPFKWYSIRPFFEWYLW